MDTGATLFSLVLLLVLAHGAGRLARCVGQPAVIGEVLAGIVLGPSLLAAAFATDRSAALDLLATVALVLFMYLIGNELDLDRLRHSTRVVVGTAAGSFLLPGLLGTVVALGLAGWPRDPSQHDWTFVLFMATAMSASALPVLARILHERRVIAAPVEMFALPAAAIIDLLSWTLLAVVTIMAASGSASPWRIALVVPLAAALVAARPLLRRAGHSPGLVLAGLLATSAATDLLQLHVVFGAFLYGVVMPPTPRGAVPAGDWISGPAALLLPLYFVLAGTGVDLRTFDATSWGTLLLVLAVAVGSKVIGTMLGGLVAGLARRDALRLGVLLNTRGLTEIVILQVGHELGVLDTEFYSIMIVIALLTTTMTAPALALLDRVRDPATPADERLAPGQAG